MAWQLRLYGLPDFICESSLIFLTENCLNCKVQKWVSIFQSSVVFLNFLALIVWEVILQNMKVGRKRYRDKFQHFTNSLGLFKSIDTEQHCRDVK